ncbi:MAG: MBL fold metallo-hydrolase [Clostridia bacterium]|nr:MBL fold metallo-hydrolase [Clostridia bacterium]
MPGAVEIISLVDNYVTASGLLAEHGLSFLVRTADQTILFDAGTGAVITHNLREMGINPREIKAVVLSHGHYDHSGGVKKICEVTGPVPVFAHPGIFGAKHKIEPGQEPKYIGIPRSQLELEQKGADFKLSQTPIEVSKGVLLTGEIPRRHGFENEANNFYLLNEEEYVADDLADDQSLVVTTAKGPVVVLGCTHSGLINTLDHILDITGADRIYAAIGGTHLKDASPERLAKTIKELPRFGLQHFVGCHCTGFVASSALAQALGDKFSYNYVGNVLKFA